MSDCMNRRCPNVAEIERLNNICEYASNEIKDQRAALERLETLLKVAKCPNSCVDGVIHATRLGVVYDEIEPCQWCAERKELENKHET
jgi:hypothetical protein